MKGEFKTVSISIPVDSNLRLQAESGQVVVSSRVVAERFRKRHSDVLEKVTKLITEMNSAGKSVQYFISGEYKDDSGKNNKEYLLTRDGFTLLAMGFTGKEALQWKLKYIEAFNQMEEVLRQKPSEVYKTPKTYKEALLHLVEQVEISEKLQAQIEMDKPKVLFADAVSTSNTTILVGDLAKLIQQNGVDMGQKRLFEWMRANGFLIKRQGADYNSPTQKSMELGLFEIKETAITHADGHVSISKTTKVTGKGQQYFINKFLGGGLIAKDAL